MLRFLLYIGTAFAGLALASYGGIIAIETIGPTWEQAHEADFS